MATNGGIKAVTVTVGDLIAAVFDVVGDQVDQAVDLLRFHDLETRTQVVVEGATLRPSRKAAP